VRGHISGNAARSFRSDSAKKRGKVARSRSTNPPVFVTAPALRLMSKRAGATVLEVKGSHAIYVSQPQAVASLIEKAAKGVQLVTAR